jgi:hypothetical protein
MYIVEPTTSGAASCPRAIPVEKVKASCSRLALPAVIWSSSLYRVEA